MAVGGGLVKWYALIEHGEEVKGEGAWENARKGEPEVTEDSGIFERKEGELWSEIAEDESLEEEWVKGGGAGCEVAAVKWGRAILIETVRKWAFGDAERDLWCAGSTVDMKVEVGINVEVGTELASVFDSEKRSGWQVVEGEKSTADLWRRNPNS